MSLRVILADDHRIVREGIRALLEKEPDVQIVGEADNGRAAVEVARLAKPDVIIMDLSMPELNGIEATRQVVEADDHVKVLALSMHSDKRFVTGALSAGASGYLLKDCASDEVVRALRALVANQTYLSPGIAHVVIDDYRHHPSPPEGSTVHTLTQRERQVLQLIAEGKTAREIAFHLGVGIKTVETHRQQLMKRLDLHTVAELTKYALREGLTSLDR